MNTRKYTFYFTYVTAQYQDPFAIGLVYFYFIMLNVFALCFPFLLCMPSLFHPLLMSTSLHFIFHQVHAQLPHISNPWSTLHQAHANFLNSYATLNFLLFWIGYLSSRFNCSTNVQLLHINHILYVGSPFKISTHFDFI